MKGLLVKDIRMIFGQRNFFLLVLFIAVILNFSSNTSYVVFYLTFVCSFFAMNSISYDEADNGYPFLFTLPIDHRTYIREKYLFGVVLNIGSWLMAVCICSVFQAVRGNLPAFMESIGARAVLIPLMLLFNSVTFPLLFKFGAEKGRIVMLCVLGTAFSVGYVLNMSIDLVRLADTVLQYPMAVLVLLIVAVTVAVMVVSYAASVMIMKKKEL